MSGGGGGGFDPGGSLGHASTTLLSPKIACGRFERKGARSEARSRAGYKATLDALLPTAW